MEASWNINGELQAQWNETHLLVSTIFIVQRNKRIPGRILTVSFPVFFFFNMVTSFYFPFYGEIIDQKALSCYQDLFF